jgi:hypothetical protein
MGPMHGAVALSAALLLGLSLGAACGPSVQSIHEGNVRFEHCYRLDLEPEAASGHRRACWSNWVDRYTYGQSRDRLEYANRRVTAFNAGDTAAPTLQVGNAARSEESRQFYLVVPAPTSVHAPPPPIATRVNAPAEPPAPPTAAASSAQSAPGEACSSGCKSAFASCSDACGAQPTSAACKSCDPDYKKCMQRCFE